uniref:ATP synthase subunit a n=1 Tax=Platencyrtus parkeri TaxID=752748 RepID=A0A7G5WI22_9HYME|nr:ATP synthase F0 subunit 6 [Platencyrtus parkeri]
MMMNLFSIFDPSTSLTFSVNWFSGLYTIMLIPLIFWFIPSRWNFILIKMMNFLFMEFKILLVKKINNMNLLIFLSLFILIFLNNFMGLFPYIFTMSSHLTISAALALTIWVSIFLFSWINNYNHMFIHLVPQGTPSGLMPFMVLVESLSNFIRAGTLSIRLTANIIAGHLLMTLISSTGVNLNLIFLIFMLLSQSLLIILEISVSLIQAYVFSVLSALYSAESN